MRRLHPWQSSARAACTQQVPACFQRAGQRVSLTSKPFLGTTCVYPYLYQLVFSTFDIGKWWALAVLDWFCAPAGAANDAILYILSNLYTQRCDIFELEGRV